MIATQIIEQIDEAGYFHASLLDIAQRLGVALHEGSLDTVPEAPDYLMAEIRYAVTHEGALHLEDVLTRRTRISIEYPHRGVACAGAVADVLTEVLGWSEEQISREVSHYLARVEAERESQQMPDDETADSARLGAPEIVPLA